MMKVLVVEDSPSMRSYVVNIIESGTDDVEIVEAENGFEALKSLPHHKFDAILTDINMPDINGLELIHFIRKSEHHRATPLVIISTLNAERDVERGLSLGANAYLPKPFTPEQLAETCARVLADASKVEASE